MALDVNNLSRIQALIHEASAKAGSQRKLAAALGYHPANVTEWLQGKRACPVQAQALMADLAGLNAEEVTLYALIEGERNPQRKESLLRVLGKGFARMSAVASCFIFGSALWAFDPPPATAATSYDVYYVK